MFDFASATAFNRDGSQPAASAVRRSLGHDEMAEVLHCLQQQTSITPAYRPVHILGDDCPDARDQLLTGDAELGE